jgi:uncharacterized protein (TIRG00374 family)
LVENAGKVACRADGPVWRAGNSPLCVAARFPEQPDRDQLVSKRLFWDVFKYVLAGGLLAYVVWSNWGQPNPIANKIRVNPEAAQPNDADAPTLTGTVIAYEPGESITVVPADGKPIQLGLVRSKWKLLKFSFVQTEAQIEWPNDPGTIQPGIAVAVWEHPRGLAYVWQRHVVEREPVHLGFLGIGALLGLTAIVLTFVRWYVLVRAQDLPFTIPDALRLGFIGFFFNSVMPGSVGGDIIKAAFLAREKSDRKTIAVATVIMDRVIALWALVWFVAISGSIFWSLGLLQGPGADQSRFIVKVAAIIVAVSFTGWMLLGLLPPQRANRFAGRLSHLPKAGHTLAEFWRAVWMYRCRQKSIAFTMLISWTGHIFFVLYFYCSARVLWDAGDPAQRIPSLAQHFLLVPIGLVIRAVPLFPGGVGIGEMGYGVLYKWLGASESCGVLGSLVNRVCDWTISIFGFFIYRHLRIAVPVESNGAVRTLDTIEESVSVG